MVSTKHITITAGVLTATVLFFGLTSVPDVWVQNHFYNTLTGQWMIVEGERPWLDFILYDGIKRGLIIMYSVMLLALLFAAQKPYVKKYRKALMILVLSGIIVPSTVVALKTLTNVPCPRDWQQYGGNYPPVGVFDSYPEEFCQEGRIRCWPAGHASFGFSLMAFYFVFRKKREKLIALSVAVGIAWSMGIYKILKGDHFLSHTIIAMVMGWLIILLIVRGIEILQGRQQKSYRTVL